MNSKDYRNIREAYLQVYAPQELTEEQVWEEVEYWVNSLLEEGYDLSDYTWEEMYEEYLSEVANTQTPQQRAEFQKKVDTANKSEIGNIKKVGGDALRTAGNILNPIGAIASNKTVQGTARRAFDASNRTFKGIGDAIVGGAQRAAGAVGNELEISRKVGAGEQPTSTATKLTKVGPKIVGDKIVGPKIVGPAATTTPTSTDPKTTPRPAAASPAASRPTATSSGPKTTPTAPTTPVKPAMGTTAGGTKFERRTPTSAELGAAQASRAAGGSEENAIKAGVGASKPATPAPNPVKANVPGLALGGKDPRASTPTPAPTPAASPSSSSGSSSPSGETDRLKKALDIKKSDVTSSFDMFDVVKGYLIGEGYADTEEAAVAIMGNMSEDWKYSIMETRMDPRGRPASGPMNVYANPKRKPDQAHLDAVKSYDEKQKKKTPEQRKKELDDYMERQMNNK